MENDDLVLRIKKGYFKVKSYERKNNGNICTMYKGINN